MASNAGTRNFCMVDMQLLRQLEEAGATGRDTRVLIAYLRHRDKEHPELPLGAWIFRGRQHFTTAKTVADRLGISENAVNKSLSHLCKLGVIRCVSRGHKGKVAFYELCESVPETEHLAEPQSVPETERKDSKGTRTNVENPDSVPGAASSEPQSVPGTAHNSASKHSPDSTLVRVATEMCTTPQIQGSSTHSLTGVIGQTLQAGDDSARSAALKGAPRASGSMDSGPTKGSPFSTEDTPQEPDPETEAELRRIWDRFRNGADLPENDMQLYRKWSGSEAWRRIMQGE